MMIAKNLTIKMIKKKQKRIHCPQISTKSKELELVQTEQNKKKVNYLIIPNRKRLGLKSKTTRQYLDNKVTTSDDGIHYRKSQNPNKSEISNMVFGEVKQNLKEQILRTIEKLKIKQSQQKLTKQLQQVVLPTINSKKRQSMGERQRSRLTVKVEKKMSEKKGKDVGCFSMQKYDVHQFQLNSWKQQEEDKQNFFLNYFNDIV